MKISRSAAADPKRPGRPALDPEDPSVQTCVTLPSKLYDDLCKRARRADVSVPEIIRRNLKEKKSKNS